MKSARIPGSPITSIWITGCANAHASLTIPAHNPDVPVTIFQVHVNKSEFKRLTAE